LADDGLTLTGSALLAGEARLLRYADVLGVEIVRDPSLRLNGYPTLRIERRGAPPLRVSTIGLGVLGELNELLATAIASGQPRLVGIVVPLRKRALAEAAALIEQGPPFDLEAIGVARPRRAALRARGDLPVRGDAVGRDDAAAGAATRRCGRPHRAGRG